jgi:hypothetical protein
MLRAAAAAAAASQAALKPLAEENYLSALGQSPEGFALMKTDPLTIGFKSFKN